VIVTLLRFGLPAFALSLLLTLLAERVASRLGVVAHPAADRWHRQPVPLLGGVAIAVVTVLGVLVATPSSRDWLVLALAGLVMAAVGLVDDLHALSPQIKLLIQIILAAALLHFGLGLHLTGFHLVDVVITLVWIVGVTNAFNLLDNMDGLSTTIAIVAAGFRLLFFVWDGQQGGMAVSIVFIGALAGFLVRNFPPAKIFMGDAGSLFLGFFLAGLTLTGAERPYSRGVVAVLVIPVLLFLIPLFDTAFVTATRLLSGRSIVEGGRDHTSHRLVAIGWTERQTVLLLAVFSIVAGAIAALSYRMDFLRAVVLLSVLVITLVLLGIYLSRVRIVQRPDAPEARAVVRLLADFKYKRQVATLILDVVLILVAYWGAYVIRFEDQFSERFPELYATLPVVLLVQIVTFGAYGLYRSIWQYTGVADTLRIVKAVSVSVMITVIALVFTRQFVELSRTIFVLDWLLLVVLVGGSRASFRFFGELLRPRPPSFQRVLIYGAGDGGELLLRELLNNPGLQRVPIGFIDDDPTKHHTRIHGLPVLPTGDQFEEVLRARAVTELIVSSAKIQGNGLERITEVCRRLDIPIRRASFRFE
jgi:UDP-GlcNAc:undecaprenyl-phosphate GlcNAc-1-phosphate transferase